MLNSKQVLIIKQKLGVCALVFWGFYYDNLNEAFKLAS